MFFKKMDSATHFQCSLCNGKSTKQWSGICPRCILSLCVSCMAKHHDHCPNCGNDTPYFLQVSKDLGCSRDAPWETVKQKLVEYHIKVNGR